MKRILTLLLAALLLASPALAAAEAPSVFDVLWSMDDWSFFEDWGVLTAEDTALLSADRTAVEAGRELIRKATLTVGEPAQLAQWLSRATFVSRTQRNETLLAIEMDGAESAHIALGAKDGLYVLDASFLQQPVALALPDLAKLPGKLITAAQDNGWISRTEAMEMGMSFSAMPGALVGLIADPPETEALDTSAWDAAVAAIEARKEYGAVEGFFALPASADCDPAARCWYLEITPADIRDLIVAALTVVRDNTFIGDTLEQLVTAGSPSAFMGRRVTFNDAFINPLLAELEKADTLLPMVLHLTGYEDEAGGLVRLEILVLDSESQQLVITTSGEMSGDELAALSNDELTTWLGGGQIITFDEAQWKPAQVLIACYQRRSTQTGVTHEVLFGDDKLEAFVEYTVSAPHGMYAFDRLLYAGSLNEDGSRTKDYAAAFCCVVNDSIPGLKSVGTQLSLLLRAQGATEYTQTDYTLDVEVHEAGFSGHAGAGAAIRGRAMHRIGNRELGDAHYTVSFEQNGNDLTGTESFSVSYGGKPAYAYEAELYTQQPVSSVFDREAVRLVDLSREQLSAWIADVTTQARAWWDGIAPATPAEDAGLPLTDVDGAGPLALQGGYLPLGSTLGYEYEWELTEGEDVLQIDEEFIQPEPDENGLIRPGDSTQMALRLTGLQEGTATLHLTWRCTIPRQETSGETELWLTVDAEGVVWLLYE